ncbi:cathelicidin-2-like [Hemicordylus capensis]|uniref:cathelicidin-2-like n=1 Tax=Hemicordylus capensis TaxID=884348 RepID=UPI002304B2A6|nr:cathelicidin-2-like [Hemicordylus capensis]
MGSHFCWALLLVLGVAVAAEPSQTSALSFDEVIAASVDIYNQQQAPEFAFRLLEAEPQPDWNASSQAIRPLKFSIKETVCRVTENLDISKCDYKENGIERDCSAFYSNEQLPATVILQCEDVNKELDRITRSRWRRFWRKTKRFVKRHGVSIGFAALRFG